MRTLVRLSGSSVPYTELMVQPPFWFPYCENLSPPYSFKMGYKLSLFPSCP